MTVAITGEKGFLGYHLTQYYKWIKQYEVISLGRDYLDNIKILNKCDFLIHCAGVNRGDKVYEGNVSLASELVAALEESNIQIDIKFTSSTQIHKDNEYGYSKLEAERILLDYCNRNNTNVLFPRYNLSPPAIAPPLPACNDSVPARSYLINATQLA